MYKFITDPNTGIKCNINSIYAREILKMYIKQYQTGGALALASEALISSQPHISGEVVTGANQIFNNSEGKLYTDSDMSNLKKYYNETLQIVTKTKNIIEDQYLNNREITDYRDTHDYKQFGMLPGQRLAADGAFGLPIPLAHHAVYIGNGMVFELAPTSELTRYRKLFNIDKAGSEIGMGITEVGDWFKTRTKKGSNIFKVNDKSIDKNNKYIMRSLFENLEEELDKNEGRGTQSVIFSNCESLVTKITTGKENTHQGEIITTLMSAGLVQRIIDKLSDSNKCKNKFLTDNNHLCINDPSYFSFVDKFSSWGDPSCIVDPRSISDLKSYRKLKSVKDETGVLENWDESDFFNLNDYVNKKEDINTGTIVKKTLNNKDKWVNCTDI